MIERMKEMITLSLKAVRRKINSENRRFCFEIFGYDFVIDEYFVPWLIEVNTNPCLEESSGLLRRYLPRMLDDAFKLTLDVISPRKRNIARPEEEEGCAKALKKQKTSSGLRHETLGGNNTPAPLSNNSEATLNAQF